MIFHFLNLIAFSRTTSDRCVDLGLHRAPRLELYGVVVTVGSYWFGLGRLFGEMALWACALEDEGS